MAALGTKSPTGHCPPVTGHPVTGHPVTSHPVTGQPVTGKPVTGQPVTWQQITGQPVTSHPVTSQPVTGHPVTGHPVTGQPVTSQPVISQPVTGQPGTDQPDTSQQSFTYDFQIPITNQFISGYSPVNVPQQTYAPSVSSHVSQGSTRRLPNIHHSGYEHSEVTEFPNPATSSKQLIPLEPDFSQMSDPSVIINPPNSTQTRPSRKEQSRRNHRSKKRRRCRSSSSFSSTSRSAFLNSSRWRKKSKRSKHSHKKERR